MTTPRSGSERPASISVPRKPSEDGPALDELFSATYEELRRLAATVRREHRAETLNPTALVNEAYIKLSATLRLTPESRLHFKRIAAREMRQGWGEAPPPRQALKRGADAAFVTLDEQLDGMDAARPDELLALDAALEQLARLEPRQAALVEYRFFGGYELSEIADLLDVSQSTLARDWRAVRAWLAVELGRTA
jgi:RNA polymerase sigma factor (TIGR02999 family)